MSLETKIEKLTVTVEKLTSLLEKIPVKEPLPAPPKEEVPAPPADKVPSPPKEVVPAPPPTDEIISPEQAIEVAARMKEVGMNLGDAKPLWDILTSFGVKTVSELPAKHVSTLLAKIEKL